MPRIVCLRFFSLPFLLHSGPSLRVYTTQRVYLEPFPLQKNQRDCLCRPHIVVLVVQNSFPTHQSRCPHTRKSSGCSFKEKVVEKIFGVLVATLDSLSPCVSLPPPYSCVYVRTVSVYFGSLRWKQDSKLSCVSYSWRRCYRESVRWWICSCRENTTRSRGHSSASRGQSGDTSAHSATNETPFRFVRFRWPDSISQVLKLPLLWSHLQCFVFLSPHPVPASWKSTASLWCASVIE